MSEKDWDAIIIGSGIGGMSCAAALAKYGWRCLIVEQHYVAGGYTHTFSRKGYHWDVGVHCVGEMSRHDIPGRWIRWLSNDSIDWKHMGSFYERFYFPDGFQIEFPSNYEGFRAELLDKFPSEAASIDRYFVEIFQSVREAKPYFATRILPKWTSHAARRIGRISSGRDYWALTVAQVLEEIVPNPKLRAVLTGQWGYYGSTPGKASFAIHAMTVVHFLDGGYYPVGGSATIAEGLLKTVTNAGGEILLRAPVSKILIEANRAYGVRLEDGREFRAKKILSGAGAKLTVSKLLPETQRNETWAKRIDQLDQSPPHLGLYLGVQGDIAAAGGTPANQWFMESWDMELRDWEINDAKSIAPILYMSFPSLKDPRHVPGPEQRHTAEVVTFVPFAAFSAWGDTRRGKRVPEYMEFKKNIHDRMLAQVRKHVPKIVDLVEFSELSTPLSTVHFTRAPGGGIYGLAPVPARFKTDDLRVGTPVKDLYLTGSDVTTLGITGALVGGVLSAAKLVPRMIPKLLA